MAVSRRDVLTLAGAVAVGGALSWGLRRLAPVGIDVAGNPAAAAALADPNAPVGGDPDGAVTLAIYSDFACPACRLADRTLAAVLAERGGGVRLLYKDWPIFGPSSRRAAELALAGARLGRYPAFADALLRAPPRLAEWDIRAAWDSVGGDWGALLDAFAAHRTPIRRHLAGVAQEAFTLGLRGTPAFLTRARLAQGALSAGEFGRLLSGD